VPVENEKKRTPPTGRAATKPVLKSKEWPATILSLVSKGVCLLIVSKKTKKETGSGGKGLPVARKRNTG